MGRQRARVGPIGLVTTLLAYGVIFAFFEFLDSPLPMVYLLGLVIITIMLYVGVTMLWWSYRSSRDLREGR